MAKLTYTAIGSLDGYLEDESGSFTWATPSDEVHAFVNDLQRPIGTYLYGRRMYQTMAAWETDPGLAGHSEIARDFARVWQAAEKIVYSRTLETVSTTRTRIEPDFDPAAVRRLKEASGQDLSIGGAGLAAEAIRAGLVDEWHLFVAPVIVGGGKRILPAGVRLTLQLLDQRRFGSGMVYLHYRTGSVPS